MKEQLGRRAFIGTGLAAAAALQMGKTSYASESQAGGAQIGLILYTIRDFMKNEEEVAQSLEKVRKIGYTIVELTGVDNLPATKVAALLKQNELKAVSAHAPFNALVSDFNKVTDWYKEVGCPHLVASVCPDEYRTKDGYAEFAKKASEMGQKLTEIGMSWGYHNHSFEFIKFDGKSGQEIMLENGDPKFFNFEIDTYWVQHGGGDPAAWIQKVAGHVPTIHMKDMEMVDGKQVFAEVGAGNMNFDAIVKAGKEAGVKYFIVEQDVCRRNPFESIEISYKNMKGMGLA